MQVAGAQGDDRDTGATLQLVRVQAGGAPAGADHLEDHLRRRVQGEDQLRVVLAAKAAEHGQGPELRVGQSIGAGVEPAALALDVVHGHDQVLGLEIGEQAQTAGTGTNDAADRVRHGDRAAGRIDHLAGLDRCGAEQGADSEQAEQAHGGPPRANRHTN